MCAVNDTKDWLSKNYFFDVTQMFLIKRGLKDLHFLELGLLVLLLVLQYV